MHAWFAINKRNSLIYVNIYHMSPKMTPGFSGLITNKNEYEHECGFVHHVQVLFLDSLAKLKVFHLFFMFARWSKYILHPLLLIAIAIGSFYFSEWVILFEFGIFCRSYMFIPSAVSLFDYPPSPFDKYITLISCFLGGVDGSSPSSYR